MAKYVFDARKYPTGTLLSELGWWENAAGGDFICAIKGADKYWRSTTVVANTFMTSKNLHTAYDILIGREGASDRFDATSGPNLTYHGNRLFPVITETGGGIPAFKYIDAYTNIGGTYVQTVAGLTTTKDDNGYNLNTAETATRLRVNADGTFSHRIWFPPFTGPYTLVASEPATWDVEGSTGLAANTPFAVVTPAIFNTAATDAAAFTFITVGTDGDEAPWPDEALVLTPPTVQVTNVTGTTADVSWS